MTTAAALILVEDDEGHARLFGRSLQRSGVRNPLIRLQSGSEALDYLAKAPDNGRGCVIVLDLNLPDIDGFEILHRLKSGTHPSEARVLVLTTTDHPNDIDRCYALGCDGFLTKPVTPDVFAASLEKLGLNLSTAPESSLAAPMPHRS